MDIVERSISELIPAEYNPRQLTEKQFNDLQASFKNLGTLEPAVINVNPERKDVIISGHQRIRVAEALGMSTYPCYEVNFPIDKEREANIRMNRNTGDWDWDALANNFEVEDLKEWGFEDSWVTQLDNNTGENSGQSPWDRMNSDSDKEYVLFSFGAISCRIPKPIYDSFFSSIDEINPTEQIITILKK